MIWVNLLKKENSWQIFFFSGKYFEWSSKNLCMEKRYLSADIKANTYKTTNKRSGVWWFTNLCKKHLKNLKYNLAKQGVHFSVRQTIPNDVSPSFYVSICQSTYIKWVKNAKLIRSLNWLFSWGFGKEFFFTKFERRRKQKFIVQKKKII